MWCGMCVELFGSACGTTGAGHAARRCAVAEPRFGTRGLVRMRFRTGWGTAGRGVRAPARTFNASPTTAQAQPLPS